jgi:ABC-2 type transport system permease protein
MTSAETLAMPSVETHRTINASRPFYWSIRRELWEHSSILFGPATVAAAVVFFAIVRIKLFTSMLHSGGQDIGTGLLIAASGLILITALFTGVFYSLDALYSERRDRSILFWKSLPVSDQTTVLSKTAIPMAVLPGVAFLLCIVTQLLLLAIFSVGLLIFRYPLGDLWNQLPSFQSIVLVFYLFAVATLWYAPVYGWLLLISAVARRAALAWAVIPFVAAIGLERFAFRTKVVGQWLQYRIGGGLQTAFYQTTHHGISGLKDATPLIFLSNPHLWTGVAGLILFVFLAIRLRRAQGPI